MDFANRIFPYDVFLSHNKEADIESLVLTLESLGLKVWFDGHPHLSANKLVSREVARALQRSRFICLYLASAFRNSEWCRAEYEPAIQIEKRHKMPRLIAISAEPCHAHFINPSQVFGVARTDLERLRAFVTLHNRYAVEKSMVSDLTAARTPIVIDRQLELLSSSTKMEQLDPRILRWLCDEVLRRRVDISEWANDLWDLRLIREASFNCLNTATASDNPNLIEALYAIASYSIQRAGNSDLRANALYLLACVATIDANKFQCFAREQIAVEQNVEILRSVTHLYLVWLRNQNLTNVSELSNLLLNRLVGIEQAESLEKIVYDARELSLPVLEKAVLWSKWATETAILDSDTIRSQGRIYIETHAIDLFDILFDSVSVGIAKRRLLGSTENQIFQLIINGFEVLIGRSEQTNGWPFLGFEKVYSRYVLPVYAFGLAADASIRSCFMTLINRTHKLFAVFGSTGNQVPFFDFILASATAEAPTTTVELFSAYMEAQHAREVRVKQ